MRRNARWTRVRSEQGATANEFIDAASQVTSHYSISPNSQRTPASLKMSVSSHMPSDTNDPARTSEVIGSAVAPTLKIRACASVCLPRTTWSLLGSLRRGLPFCRESRFISQRTWEWHAPIRQRDMIMNALDIASGLNFNFILKIAGQQPPLPGQGPPKPLPSLVPDIFPALILWLLQTSHSPTTHDLALNRSLFT